MNWALFGLIEEAGINILTLTEGLEAPELARSRLTRHEVRRQLLNIAGTLAQLPQGTREQLPELDWDAWTTTVRRLDDNDLAADTLWFAVKSLTPATLMWLRFYRERQPELFEFKLSQ